MWPPIAHFVAVLAGGLKPASAVSSAFATWASAAERAILARHRPAENELPKSVAASLGRAQGPALRAKEARAPNGVRKASVRDSIAGWWLQTHTTAASEAPSEEQRGGSAAASAARALEARCCFSRGSGQ
eukprot:3220498-Pyramimonas_sp.AAC.1